MKNIKKIVPLLLLCILVLSMSSFAFADTNSDYTTTQAYKDAHTVVSDLKAQYDKANTITLNYTNFKDSDIWKQVENDANKRQAFYDLYSNQIQKNIVSDYKGSTKLNSNMNSMVTMSGTGTYPTRSGVVLICDTPSGSSGSFLGHAGIITSSTKTEESFAKGWGGATHDGVYQYNNDWNTRYSSNKVYAVSASSTTTQQDATVATWCANQQGCPYNWTFSYIFVNDFLNHSGSYYCSELVWAGFYKNIGLDLSNGDSQFIGGVLPMDLYYDSGTYCLYTNF